MKHKWYCNKLFHHAIGGGFIRYDKDNKVYIMTLKGNKVDTQVEIKYCPFCGIDLAVSQ